MKKVFLSIMCVCFCLLLFGCDNETMLRVVHFSNNTLGKSTTYSFQVVLDDDDRVQGKYVDLQIKSDKEKQHIQIGEQNKDDCEVTLDKKDFWYNLTYLIDKTNGVSAESGYLKFEQHGNKIFNLTVPNDVKLTFRFVAGSIKKDAESEEEILVLDEPISDEFVINARKHAK